MRQRLYAFWLTLQRDDCRYCRARMIRRRLYRHVLREHLDQHVNDMCNMLATQARKAEEACLHRLYAEIQESRERFERMKSR